MSKACAPASAVWDRAAHTPGSKRSLEPRAVTHIPRVATIFEEANSLTRLSIALATSLWLRKFGAFARRPVEELLGQRCNVVPAHSKPLFGLRARRVNNARSVYASAAVTSGIEE